MVPTKWVIFEFLFLNSFLYFSCFAKDDNLFVKTSNGLLKGKLAATRDMQVRQFLGIPYGHPPVGELRFAKPKPYGNWEGVRDAVEFGPVCVQAEVLPLQGNTNVTIDKGEPVPQSEDCLSLNVYTPTKATPSDKFAVMVWIHGGGFETGSGRTYNPSLLVALYNVVMVTINYRLGVFGFFNIPGTDVKGNYGMHDQILSLQWVQQNIAAFGGNPDQVTIFGQSAGGMSVSSHLLSPLSKGLFHHVIAQSGSSLSPYSCGRVLSTHGLHVFKKAVQCDGDHNKFMECLREKRVEEILAAKGNPKMQKIQSDTEYLTRAIVDGEYLPDDPKTLLQNGQVNKAEVILGVVANDGGFHALYCVQKDTIFDKEWYKACIQPMLPIQAAHGHLSKEAVFMEYLSDIMLQDTEAVHQMAMDTVTDLLSLAPTILEADLLQKAGNPVYMYVMDHEPHSPRFPKWLRAYHSIDLPYTFGQPLDNKVLGTDVKWFLPGNFSKLEEGFSKYVMQLWSNFAKYGNPNAAGHMPVTWPQYDNEHVHLRLSVHPRIQRGLRERKVKFWMEFFPKLVAETKPQNKTGVTEARA